MCCQAAFVCQQTGSASERHHLHDTGDARLANFSQHGVVRCSSYFLPTVLLVL